MYLKKCISFDTRKCIETTYVLDNGMEWDLVWTTGGAYDKSFNRVLSIKKRVKCLTSEYKYEYKKIIMTDYSGNVNEYVNLYRVPRTFLTAYFDTDIISQICAEISRRCINTFVANIMLIYSPRYLTYLRIWL